jgi:hypothetical protein
MIEAQRNASLEESFQVHIGPPIAKLRMGILRGPRIGDEESHEVSILAVGIDGSITLLKRCTDARMRALRRIQLLLSEESSIGTLTFAVLIRSET